MGPVARPLPNRAARAASGRDTRSTADVDHDAGSDDPPPDPLQGVDARQDAQGDEQDEIHHHIGGEAPDRDLPLHQHRQYAAGRRVEMQRRGHRGSEYRVAEKKENAEADQLPIDADQAAGAEVAGYRDAAETDAAGPPGPFFRAPNGVQKRQRN